MKSTHIYVNLEKEKVPTVELCYKHIKDSKWNNNHSDELYQNLDEVNNAKAEEIILY